MSLPIAQLAVGGIAIGGAYGLIATAYSLVYRTTRTINFALGDMAVLGAYVAYAGPGPIKDRLWLGSIVAVAAIALLSVVVEIFAFRPLYRHGPVFVVASSIALVFVLEDLIQLLWGTATINAPAIGSGSHTVGGVVITDQQILILGVAITFLAMLQVFLKTRTGIAMRSSAENREVAALLGISPRVMITISFALAGVAASIGGILVAPLTLLRPGAGGIIGLTAVIAAIVGGLGTLPGALLGGMVIGLVQVFSSYLVGGQYSSVITFSILILLLLVRPSGLFGEEGLATRQ